MIFSDPGRLWYLSTVLHSQGHHRIARLIKAYNFAVFRAILPPEAKLSGPVSLGHFGLNVVIHPNVSLGTGVHIWHNVTLAVSDSPGSSSRLCLGNNVVIGTGAVVVTREKQSLSICSDVRIGANSVVTKDLDEPGHYHGAPARASRVNSTRS